MPKRAAESPESPAKRTAPPEPGAGDRWADFLKWMHFAGGFFFAALPMDIIRMIGDMLGEIHTASIASKVAVVEAMLNHPSEAARDAFWSNQRDVIHGIPAETLAEIGYYRLAPSMKINWSGVADACTSAVTCTKFISNGVLDIVCANAVFITKSTSYDIVSKMMAHVPSIIDRLVEVGYVATVVEEIGGTYSEEVAELAWRIANAVPETSQYYPGEFWDDLLRKHRERFFFKVSSVYKLEFLGNICKLCSVINKRCKTWDNTIASTLTFNVETIRQTICESSQGSATRVCAALVKFCSYEPAHVIIFDTDIITWVLTNAPPADALMTMSEISELPTEIPKQFAKSDHMYNYVKYCINNPTDDALATLFNFSKDHPVIIGKWLHRGELGAKISNFNHEAASPAMCESVSRLIFCFYDYMYSSTHVIDIKTWDKFCEASQCADAKREKAHVLKAVRRRLRTIGDGEPSAASGKDD